MDGPSSTPRTHTVEESCKLSPDRHMHPCRGTCVHRCVRAHTPYTVIKRILFKKLTVAPGTWPYGPHDWCGLDSQSQTGWGACRSSLLTTTAVGWQHALPECLIPLSNLIGTIVWCFTYPCKPLRCFSGRKKSPNKYISPKPPQPAD